MGCADILGRIVEDLKDESEPYRRMVMETIDKVTLWGRHAASWMVSMFSMWRPGRCS